MSKDLFISEKPSVAQQFAQALDIDPSRSRRDGYIETDRYIVTWCVGHLVTMSYPDKYDESLRRWRFDSLPFIPEVFRYEIIDSVKKQFDIVSGLLHREDVSTIYICTDSGREGEYIYRLVDMMAKVSGKEKKRVWIDSQTREEILRGIREAKPDTEYDNLSAAAFSRAKEDYLMGINFSRALTLKYGKTLSRHLGRDKNTVISVGRVMTCVLGMIVRREEEIRSFQKTNFYKINGIFAPGEADTDVKHGSFRAEFRSSDSSTKYAPTDLYKNNGFLKQEKAVEFMKSFQPFPREAVVESIERKKESKNPPLLYNLAELQNDCSRMFKINPDETLAIAQELYEKKLTTYPRTDARVLSSAVAKEIQKNISGLRNFAPLANYAGEVLTFASVKSIGSSRYTDDKKITDHYAIIPTGQGMREYQNLKPLTQKVYQLIVRRFLSIFYPPAVYQKMNVSIVSDGESFVTNSKVLKEPGYLTVAEVRRQAENAGTPDKASDGDAGEGQDGNSDEKPEADFSETLLRLKKGQKLKLVTMEMKEGETAPPKRYTSGTMILAMENAGNLIEDDDLRAQIKGAGIGTSATRAGILTKLEKIGYIALNKKTQVLTPTKLGELVTQVVKASVRQLLNPELTASWEKGLSYVADGTITEQEYMDKLEQFVRTKTNAIKNTRL
ncbi:MAG: DNA topoisomerase [Oribacterium sp.]|nr:DNA topoisomerase [Oribacterium sp.]